MIIWGNVARFALLQELLARPGYGMELKRRIEERTGGDVVIGDGSVYDALRSLRGDGMIRVRRVESPQGGGRKRIYYQITSKGKRAAHEQMASTGELACVLLRCRKGYAPSIGEETT